MTWIEHAKGFLVSGTSAYVRKDVPASEREFAGKKIELNPSRIMMRR